jgi:hypothetical protein
LREIITRCLALHFLLLYSDGGGRNYSVDKLVIYR